MTTFTKFQVNWEAGRCNDLEHLESYAAIFFFFEMNGPCNKVEARVDISIQDARSSSSPNFTVLGDYLTTFTRIEDTLEVFAFL